MYEEHRTKDGKEMLICQMDDKHLGNTINLFLNKLGEAKRLLTLEISENKFKSALRGRSSKDLTKAAERAIREITEKLYPYLAESMLRGIYYTERMQAIFERKGAEADIGYLPLNEGYYLEEPDAEF